MTTTKTIALVAAAACAACSFGKSFSLSTDSSGGSSGNSGGLSSSSGGGSSPSAAQTRDAYKTFAIRGVQLGLPLEGQDGFTCGPPRGTDGFTTQNHSCVKFLDERCKGRPTKIHNIRSTADVPRGQSCFMEEFTGATYLDREYLAPPLLSLRIVGTDTENPKIFQLEYTFAADDLTRDSKLGKALIAKYGKPSYENAPMQMSWQIGDIRLDAACRTIGGDNAADGEYCRLTVRDDDLDRKERELEQQRIEDQRRANAPAAPEL